MWTRCPLGLTPPPPLSQWLVLALAPAAREEWALYEQEGGFGDLTDESKGRDPSWGNKPPLRSGTPHPLRLTSPPPLPQWLVLSLLLEVREDLALSKQEGGFGDLTDDLKRRYPSWWNKHTLRSSTWCPIGLTPPPSLPQWPLLTLELSLATREALALSKQEGGFGELTDGLKERYPSWGIRTQLHLVTPHLLRFTPMLLMPRWMVLTLAAREALAIFKKEGGFGELTDGLKWREPSLGIKPPLHSGNCCLLRITPPPPLTRWLVLALALSLAVSEDLALSKQEDGFGELTYGSKGGYPSWGIKPTLHSGNPRRLVITPTLPLPQWLVVALALLLAVREALALYEQEGDFKDLTEGSEVRDPSWGNKYSQRLKPERFYPDNAAYVADVSTADTDAAVVATAWILCLKAVHFALDIIVQTRAEFFLMTRMKGDVFVVS